MKIKSLNARKILNSRQKPAIEVVVNKKFFASAPSGASTGQHEVKDFTKGIDYAVGCLNKNKSFKGLNIEEFEDLRIFEKLIPEIGGNPVIATQFACLKAASNGKVWEFLNPHAAKMPMPLGNCVGGGAHVGGVKPDIQEFLLMPKTRTFKEAAFLNLYVYKNLGKILKTSKRTDEGAWCPTLSNQEIFETATKIVEETSAKFKVSLKLGVDVAASQLYKKGRYAYQNFSKEKKNASLTKAEQIRFIQKLIRNYKLGYVEDPLQENDYMGFSKIKKGALICGDDLICTNIQLFEKAVKSKSVNCIIIKPNQVGSINKTKELVDLAKKSGITTVISHRSGETMDATISHLAFAWEIPFIKCGIFGKERQAKINELIRIEQEIVF
ncbi:phosphopyruvate hydratase [Candidatus Woesearchaeota archaeon]|nr:phosphopyruvate hydratase [Candidatus Woesearchaeota archaeon]